MSSSVSGQPTTSTSSTMSPTSSDMRITLFITDAIVNEGFEVSTLIESIEEINCSSDEEWTLSDCKLVCNESLFTSTNSIIGRRVMSSKFKSDGKLLESV